MSPQESRILWCLVEGEPIPYYIHDIPIGANVTQLKQLIMQSTKHPNNVTSHHLKLWKLDVMVPIDPDRSLVQRLAALGNIATCSRELSSAEEVGELFPAPPSRKHLHIVVQCPEILSGTSATITPSPSQNSNISVGSPPSWLVEIHRKLWGMRELLGEIFRTANLTKDDFIELQDQLQKLNPERISESYVAKDVLATKSAFLRSKSTALCTDLGEGLVPRLVFDTSQPPSSNVVDDDDDDAVADDAMDIDTASGHVDTHGETHLPNEATATFPYTIRYVDLTVLKLKTKYSRLPQLMLFRDEWGSMIDFFNKRTNNKGMAGSAVFTGQPGIGKTCLLYSILILCIISAKPIVFQDMAGNVFIIDDTVRPPNATPALWEDVDDVLTLVDADGASCEPAEYLLGDQKHRILLISSPRSRANRKWINQMVQAHYPVFLMEPWSREEFVVASLFLQSNDITLKRLQEASRICGNIPRQCFKAAVSPAELLSAMNEIRKAINEEKDLSAVVINASRDTLSHRMIQIRPSSKDRFWNSCLIEPVSDWAFSEMIRALQDTNANAAYQFYCTIKGSPESSSLGGKMFENRLHPFLQTPRSFIIESLDDRSATLEIQITSNTDYLAFGKTDFSGQLALSVKEKRSCYLQPLSPVSPSFDSFLYQHEFSESGFSPLIGLQVTTTAKHAIKIKGLKDVQTSLKRVPELNKLRPTKAKKMIILFVVPKTLGAAFLKQTIEDAATGHWYEKIAQYVLVLDEEDVLKAR